MLAIATNIAEYTVSELAFALKRTVEETYSLVRVRGELSGFKRAASGHLYFTLKDDKACLDAVAWRGSLPRLAFEPVDGLEVVCSGRLTTYPGRSKYQIVVEQIEPAGLGALMALLEERKRKLEAEGLFAAERKRPLPYLPEVIGIVTSPTGAVIRDILHRLAERFPRRVVLWPVLVQGEGAAEQVAAAIDGFATLPPDGPVPRPDVVIVARGGGSIEDLWAFNEERVVRAAARCSIPLVSAVGHETDTTLIDHVADRRAPTPSAAAEMVVPVRRELLVKLQSLHERQEHGLDREVAHLGQRLEAIRRGLPDPRQLIGLAAQRLDDLAERLRLRTPSEVLRHQRDRLEMRYDRLGELVRDARRCQDQLLATLDRRLLPELVGRGIGERSRNLERDVARLDQAAAGFLGEARQRLEQETKLLMSLSHERVLERGFAIVRARPDGHVLPRLASAQGEVELDIQFADGTLPVLRAGAAITKARRPSPAAVPQPEQGSLL